LLLEGISTLDIYGFILVLLYYEYLVIIATIRNFDDFSFLCENQEKLRHTIGQLFNALYEI